MDRELTLLQEAAIAAGSLSPYYKTRMCTAHVMRGSCVRGERCYYAHSARELRTLTAE